MSVSVAQFLVQFPEFGKTDNQLVVAHLAAADLEIDRSVWKTKGDQGQMYLAAHKLALSPYGLNTRLDKSSGTTTYFTHYKELRLQVTSGFRVA